MPAAWAKRASWVDPSSTHIRFFQNGTRIEFRPGKHGGWASRASFLSTETGHRRRFDNWIYFGPEFPRDAVQIRDSKKVR